MFFSPLIDVTILTGLLFAYWLFFTTARQRIRFIGIASLALLAAWVIVRFDFNSALCFSTWFTVITGAVFLLARLVQQSDSNLLFGLACLFPVGALVTGKYLANGLHLPLPQVPSLYLGLGLSYYTLKHLHFIVESKRQATLQPAFATYFAYTAFFPMFTAGPIERLPRFLEQAESSNFCRERFAAGLERIILGLGKKVILADMILAGLQAPEVLTIGGAPNLSWGQLLFAGFAKFLHIYVEFSGYTDIVIGVGMLFGFSLMENFHFPLLRPNLAEFWRAWHISLASWVRDYIYFPLLTALRSPSVALIVAMLSMGLWHAAKPGWILWGLHHGCGLVVLSQAQRWASRSDRLQRLRNSMPWRLAGILAVWWYVSVGHALTFHAHSWYHSLKTYSHLMTGGLLG